MFKRLNTIRTVYDMYRYEKELNKKLANLPEAERRTNANEVIKAHTGYALGGALIPVPAADILAVSAVQLNMVRHLARIYQVSFKDALGKTIIAALAGTGVARLGASAVKAIPLIGTVIGEMSMGFLSGVSTYALGHVIANHLDNGGTLEQFNLKEARKQYLAQIIKAKEATTAIQQQKPLHP